MLKTCPISSTMVDENVVRLNGLFTIILLSISYFFPWVLYWLLADFIIKIIKVKYSPVATISKTILHSILKKSVKPVDFAPKRFAMIIGAFMTTILIILYYFNIPVYSNYLLDFFILAAVGETFFRFCIGCKIYSLYFTIKLKLKK